MSDLIKRNFEFPSVPPAPSAPPADDPRGGADAKRHQSVEEAATAAAVVKPIPANGETAKALQYTAALRGVSQLQDDALPGLVMKRGLQGVAVGGGGYALYRLIRYIVESIGRRK